MKDQHATLWAEGRRCLSGTSHWRSVLGGAGSGLGLGIGLLAFGLALRAQGWRITYLGADTPTAALAGAAARVQPTWVVLSSVDGSVFRREMEELAELAAGVPTAIGGAGASPSLADGIGAELLTDDPVRAAAELGRVARVPAAS